jgi:hypothetical protein
MEKTAKRENTLFVPFIKYYIIRVIKNKEDGIGGEFSAHGDMRNVYKIFFRKAEWKRSLGGVDGIKMNLRIIGVGGVVNGLIWLRMQMLAALMYTVTNIGFHKVGGIS